MIQVEVITKDPYYILKDANLISVGKRANYSKDKDGWIMFPGNDILDSRAMEEDHKKRYAYFKRCFLAEHSTIEMLSFRIFDDDCRADVAHQVVRHTKSHPRYVVQSGRPDWNNGKKRLPPDEDWRFFLSVWNPLAFMQAMRQRLCMRAQSETRHWAQVILDVMLASGDPMLEALADCCVPNCEYRGGRCYELQPCGRCPACNI